MSNPYAEAYAAYWDAGWRGILPLPYQRKAHPPTGYTGRDGAYPSFADCHAWSEEQPHNICLRLPDTVIGIDVDHYDGKLGGDTLTELVRVHGPLPATWLSTSRDDGISGIRLYRVPAGTTLPTKLPGIEFVQHHHRYAVVHPSVHPSGRRYEWIDETTGARSGETPAVDRIPELPRRWIDGLAVVAASGAAKADIDQAEAFAILTGMPKGEPCVHVLQGAGKAMAGGDRHDSYNEAVLAVVGAGRRGCAGAMVAVERLRASFMAEVTTPGSSMRRSDGEANAEWSRSLLGALALVADETQGTACPDDVLAEWMTAATAASKNGDPDDTSELPPEPTAFDRAVLRRYADLRINEAARERLAVEAAGQAPPLHGVGLDEFLAQPDEEEQYRIAGLWPSEGRVLLPAPAKAGKTTLIIGNLIPALVDGGEFLGAFTTTPVSGRVVLLNMEVGERTLRRWAARAGVASTSRVTVVNLRGRVAALGLSTDAGRRRFTEFLKRQEAEVVILDPLAPVLASLGLVEDSNADVATFFGWWSEALGDAGVVDDLICHHTGHAGARSRGASRLLDEPDAIWTLTRDGGDEQADDDDPFGPVEQRFLKAYGRDVDLPESGLTFSSETGRLLLVEGDRRMHRRLRAHELLEQRVLAYAAQHPGRLQRELCKEVTGNGDAVVAAVKRLVERGALIAVPTDSGKGLKHYVDSPAGTPSPTVPNRPQSSLGTATYTVPPSPHPRGDGVEDEESVQNRPPETRTVPHVTGDGR